MTQRLERFAMALAGSASLLGPMLVRAQDALPVNDKPFQEKWAPTEFGANDKAGAVNCTTPEMVLKAVRLIKQGATAICGRTQSGRS